MAKAARKRKKEEDEAFELPEFDEVAYMKKETTAAVASFTIIGLAIVIAILLYAITLAGAPIVAFFVGLAATFLLPRIFQYLPWPKVDTSKFERRDWIGHGGTFFFSWLAFWILLLNVPFVDVTPPVIEGVTVSWGMGDQAVNAYPGQNSYTASGAVTLTINATVQENGLLAGVEFTVNTNTSTPTALGGSRYSLAFPRSGDNYDVTIFASDAAGHSSEFSFAFSLSG